MTDMAIPLHPENPMTATKLLEGIEKAKVRLPPYLTDEELKDLIEKIRTGEATMSRYQTRSPY